MKKESGMLLVSRDGETVLLEGVRATGRLEDTLLSMTIEQRYRNPGITHIEAVYTFPLPWGSVLMGVEVELGGKRLTGEVAARKQADEKYEQALSEGDAAILLERNRDGTHTLNLGNLAPGEDCVIRIRYAQAMAVEQGSVRLTLPTAIAPRFGDPVKAGLRPQQVPESDLFVEYPFEMIVDVNGTLAGARIASPSHPLSVGPLRDSGADGVRISLSRSSWLDRDVVLVLDQLQHESLGQAMADPFTPGQVAVKLALKPRGPRRETPLMLKVLVDCSFSMQGDSIKSARRALQAIVQKLKENERFSLSRFGDKVMHRSRALWAVTPATRLGAERWVSQLQADLGGTEMEGALASTFALGGGPAHVHAIGEEKTVDGGCTEATNQADVLLVTDGNIYNVNDTVELARRSGHRVFVVGIGSATNHELIRQLAEATGGACEFVAPGEAVEPAVLRMFNRLRGGRLKELRLEWPTAQAPVWQQDLPLSVFEGDTVEVHAIFAAQVAGDVLLSGIMGDRVQEAPNERIAVAEVSLQTSEVKEASGDSNESASILARMVAWSRVSAMRNSTASKESLIAEALRARITEMSVSYQLVTDETSFALVHERAEAEKATDMPKQVRVRQMLAAGWAGSGSIKSATHHATSYSRSDLDLGNADYSSMSVPAVWRTSRSGPRVEDPSESLAIPAFLRESASETVISARPRGKIDARPRSGERSGHAGTQSVAMYWASDHMYEGLTPLGLSVWLSEHAADQWPADLQALAAIGLGQEVIDWIEFVLEPHLPALTQRHDTVALFLRWIRASVRWLAIEGTPQAGTADTITPTELLLPEGVLADKVSAYLAQALAGITVCSWPPQLFDLAAYSVSS